VGVSPQCGCRRAITGKLIKKGKTTMKKTKIPEEIKEKANKLIADFNVRVYKKKSGVEFHAVYKGDFLYLKRKEGERDGPIARLRYNGKLDNWGFAIYKWSNERYDPDEIFFPGSKHLNGSIEGALKAGHEAYPPSWEPSHEDMLNFFKQLLGK
jgi:hypothetical protein